MTSSRRSPAACGRRPHLHVLWSVVLAALLCACTSVKVPADYPREPSAALPVGTSTPLGDAMQALAAAHPPGRSGFRLLTRGNQA